MDIKGFKSRDGVVYKYDYNALVNVPEGGSTPSGGKDGGYYTPAVTQPNRETIQFAFTPSKADMPNVNPVTVSLPNPGGDVADEDLPLIGSTDEITPMQAFQAFIKGRQVMLQLTAEDTNLLFTSFSIAGSSDSYSGMIFSTIVGLTGDFNRPQCDVMVLAGSTEGKTWSVMHQQLPVMADVPTDEYIKGLIEAELKNHPGSGGNVAYDEAQNLTDEQKAQARENIGAADIADIPSDEHIIDLIEENAPESSGGGIAVTGAKVGQTVKIAEVDENGVPTAWESVDFPSGGGGGEWKLLADITTEEPVNKILIDEGIPDGVTGVYMFAKAKYAEVSSYNYIAFQVNGTDAFCGNKGIEDKENCYHGLLDIHSDGTGHIWFSVGTNYSIIGNAQFSLSNTGNNINSFRSGLLPVTQIGVICRESSLNFAVGTVLKIYVRC